MGSLNPFSKPKIPALPSTGPTEAEKKASALQAQEDDKKRRAQQQGRGATLLTGGQGVMGDDTSGLATKRLLGG